MKLLTRLREVNYSLISSLISLVILFCLIQKAYKTYSFNDLGFVIDYFLLPLFILSNIFVFILIIKYSSNVLNFKFKRNKSVILWFYEKKYTAADIVAMKKNVPFFLKKQKLHKHRKSKLAHKLFIEFVEDLKENNEQVNIVFLQELYKELGFYKISTENIKYDSYYLKAMGAYRLSVLDFDSVNTVLKEEVLKKHEELSGSILFSTALIEKDLSIILKRFDVLSTERFTIELQSKFFYVFKTLGVNNDDLGVFLKSKNPNLRAVGIAYLTKKNKKINNFFIDSLLNDKSDFVRKEIYLNLRRSDILNNDVILLLEKYELETFRNKVSILKTLQKSEKDRGFIVENLSRINLNNLEPEEFYQIIKTIYILNEGIVNHKDVICEKIKENIKIICRELTN